MKIAGSTLQTLLAQATGQQVGTTAAQRASADRAALAVPGSQAHAAVSVHISAAGRAASAVSGTTGLAATARAQGTSQAIELGGQGNVSVAPSPQIQTIRRIVEQITGKQLGVFNGADLGPMSQIGSSAASSVSAAAGVVAGAAGNVAAAVSQVAQLLQFSASGMATAMDGAQIGFTVLLELESSLVSRQSLEVRVNHVGMPTPEVSYAGPASELAGHAFRFDLGTDGGADATRPQMIGSGVVAFDDTPTVLGRGADVAVAGNAAA